MPNPSRLPSSLAPAESVVASESVIHLETGDVIVTTMSDGSFAVNGDVIERPRPVQDQGGQP